MDDTTVKKSPHKLTVSDGDFDTQKQKMKFNKQMILGYLSKGANKKSAAAMVPITEQTFYNYINDDEDFKARVVACLGGEDEIQAKLNLSLAVKHGDLEASKYILNKTRHYEKRYDPKWMDPTLIETQRNPSTGMFEIVTDMDEISSQLLGEEFELDSNSGLDDMEQILMAQDRQSEDIIKELMGVEEEE